MATLNTISDDILDTLNRSNDIQFKNRVKYVFLNELASTLRQEIHKHQITDGMKQTYVAPIVKVTNNDNPSSTKVVTLYRTKYKVSKPVRYNTDDPFLNISAINTNSIYTYIKDGIESIFRSSFDLNRFNASKPVYYSYRNDYIYLYNIELPVVGGVEQDDIVAADKFVVITGVHNTFDFIDKITNESSTYNLAFNDDVELPVSDDLIQMTKIRLLSSDFSLIDSKDKMVSTNMDNN